jgi:hypothetical protein
VLGINDNVLQGQHLDAIRAMRPAANFILDPKGETSGAMKAAYPSALLIGRPYIPDSELHDWYLNGDPTQAGNRAAAICLSHRQSNPAVDAWALLNEPPVSSVEQIARLAAFDIAFARAMWAGGSRGCVGAFARGTPQIPDIDGGTALRAYMPALRVAEEIGALVAIHQYGFNPLLKDAEWNALRWQIHILPWLASQGLRRFEYVITETGCDLGTGRVEDGQVADGWKHAFGDTPAGRESYAAQLLTLIKEYAKDPRCKGAMLFCAGNQNRWGSFDVTGEMLSRLMAVQWPPIASAPPVVPPVIPPKPPEPEVPMNPVKPFTTWLPSPNFTPNKGIAKDTIVYHHTAGGLKASLAHLRSSASGVSTNYLVAKTGAVYQLVADTDIAWHSGYSLMPDGRENVNNFSFGIEIENVGDGKDPYPQVQIDAIVALSRYLVGRYGIKREKNVTHQLIRKLWKDKYPGRLDDQGRPIGYKTDPRGLDMEKLLNRIYAVSLKYDKIVWAIEQSARTLQQEGLQAEHDYIVQVIIPPLVKLRDDQ